MNRYVRRARVATTSLFSESGGGGGGSPGATGATGAGGATGATGAAGATGATGTTTAITLTAGFTMPAVGATSVATMNSTSALRTGAWVFINGAGWLAVIAVGGPTTATLENIPGVSGNVAPTTVTASGALVVVGGPALEPTKLDVRRFGATPSDVGPGVAGALTAAAAATGGSVVIPPLENAIWTWVTPVTADFTGVNPGSVEVCGDATNIQLASSNTAATVLLLENAPSSSISVRGLNFVGILGAGPDGGDIITIGFVANALVENCCFYGVGGNTSIVNLSASTVCARQLTFSASSQSSANGGIIFVSGDAIEVDNVRIFDIGSFDANAANKPRGTCDIYVLLASSVHIHDCMFDEDNMRNIWVNAGFAGFFTGSARIENCRFNTPNPASGFDCAIRTDGPGTIKILEVVDCFFPGAFSGTVLNLANVDNVRVTGAWGLAGSTGNGTPNPLDGPHLIQTRANVGSVTIIDSNPALTFQPNGGAPTSTTIVQNGTTTSLPYGLTGVVAYYDADQLMAINPAFNLGIAGTFAPVAAGHQLNFTYNRTLVKTVTFTGAENSAATFAATIQTALNAGGTNGATATVVGGQVQITLPTAGGGNNFFITESEGAIDASDADVLASLGYTVGPFTNPSTVASWGDSMGVDATHNLTVITGAPIYAATSTFFGGRPTVTTTAADALASVAWSAALPQPLTVVIVGRLVSSGGGATATFLDSNTVANFILQARATQFFELCPSTIAFNATCHDPSVFICRFSGAASDDFAQNSLTLQAPQNAGANGLPGVTIGNEQSGGNGGVEIAAIVILNHIVNLTERRLLVEAFAVPRYGVVEVP